MTIAGPLSYYRKAFWLKVSPEANDRWLLFWSLRKDRATVADIPFHLEWKAVDLSILVSPEAIQRGLLNMYLYTMEQG